MPYLEGLLSGFSGRKAEIEAQNLAAARRSQEREERVYKTLLNSSDKETRDLAIAGLLESAEPRRRKGGIQGWLGEMEQSPYLAQIRALSPEVETEEPTYGLPSRSTTGYIGTIPAQQSSLAQAPTSPTEVGAPPPTPVTPLPSAALTREVSAPLTGTRTVRRPRQTFRTPLQTATEQASGQYGGRVQGIVQAIEEQSGRKLTPEEVKQIGLELSGFSASGVGAAPFQAIGGETTDPDGTVRSTYASFNRMTQRWEDVAGTPLTNFRQRPTGAAVASLGIYAERAARQLGYSTANAAGIAGPEAMQRVNELAQRLQAEAGGATTTARGEAAADIPLSTRDQFLGITRLQDEWRAAVAPVRQMQQSMRLIETALQRYKAGDRLGAPEALRIAFVRLTEPSSVVMPSEYARQGQGLSYADRFMGTLENAIKGGPGIPLDQLEAVAETARQFLQGMEGWNTTEAQRLTAMAKKFGLDPTLIFGGTTTTGGPPPPPSGAGATAPVSAAPRARRDAQGNWILTIP